MATQTPQLTEVQRSRLIELVRPHPMLYDMSHKMYRETVKKQEVWQSIMEAMNMPELGVEGIAKKWKSIVDTYRKNVTKSNKSTGSAKGSDIRWAHWDAMSFMEKFIDCGETCSNIDEQVVVPPSQQDLFSSSSGSTDSQKEEKEYIELKPMQQTPGSSRPKKRPAVDLDGALVDLVQVVKSAEAARASVAPKTEKDLFGELVAKKVQKLDEDLFSDLQLEVLELIRAKNLEQANRNSTVHNYIMDTEGDRYNNLSSY